LELLSRGGHRAQHFRSTACFACCDGAVSATGANSRHLDSWLMTPEVCRETFAHGSARAEISIVDGQYDQACDEGWQGGRLDLLCDWLDLPRVVVVDASQVNDCRVPVRPQQTDAILLDGVISTAHFAQLQTTLETLWGIPVLGALDQLPTVRAAIARLPRGAAVPKELCQQLAAGLRHYTRIDRLAQLAARRAFHTVPPYVFREERGETSAPVTVAVAFDEVFRCYFADTLELLELAGVTVIDFSPLRDEALPPETDLVYLGCGHPERHAAALAGNHCMRSAFRKHLCAGGRIYAEGGGLAYLCEHLVTVEGNRFPMVGLLPISASANALPQPPVPTEVVLARNCWFGRKDTRVRGYRNSNWRLEANSTVDSLACETQHRYDLLGRYQAVGSSLHLNLVPQPEILRSFLRPGVVAPASC